MRVNSKKIIGKLEAIFPAYLADDWDNVGFQIGNIDRVIDSVLVCLEVTHQVIDEAVEKCIDLIIAHHPLIFKMPQTLSESNPKAQLITRLIKENINLFVMHTNFDQAEGGLSDMMADQIGLVDIKPLIPVYCEKLYKTIVYVPVNDFKKVEQAAFNAGAGGIGNYSECGFSHLGKGSFKPHEGASPAIGLIDKRESVEEISFETLVKQSVLEQVVKAIEQAHPYEEVAIDIIPLQNKGACQSLGRIGELSVALSIADFVEHLKQTYHIPALKVSVPKDKHIKKVAVISGAGMSFIDKVASHTVDAFVTGDVKYHEIMETRHYGLVVADVGHFESEVIFSKELAKILQKIVKEANYDVRIETSETECSPFCYY